jgi:hypothetical protein
MKKINKMMFSLVLLGLMTASTANASYQVIYGEKQINGENISFVSKWLSSDPLLSSWVNVGSPTGCTAWTPDTNTVNMGVSFPQTGSGCNQDQTRTVQEREQNNVSHEYRNVGSIKNESQTLKNQTTTRTAIGTKTVEECNVANSSWTAGSPSYALLNIIWAGTLVYSGGEYAATEKVVGTYTYKKGTITSNSGYSSIWTVCRVPM